MPLFRTNTDLREVVENPEIDRSEAETAETAPQSDDDPTPDETPNDALPHARGRIG